jgi:hypothetical protein
VGNELTEPSFPFGKEIQGFKRLPDGQSSGPVSAANGLSKGEGELASTQVSLPGSPRPCRDEIKGSGTAI